MVNQKLYGLLPFGTQLESEQEILVFDQLETWKQYVTEQLGNDSWYNEQDIESAINGIVITDGGYITQYGFRLPVNDLVSEQLRSLSRSNNDTITVQAMSGDQYTLPREDFIKIVDQYMADKQPYLATVERQSNAANV